MVRHFYWWYDEDDSAIALAPSDSAPLLMLHAPADSLEEVVRKTELSEPFDLMDSVDLSSSHSLFCDDLIISRDWVVLLLRRASSSCHGGAEQ